MGAQAPKPLQRAPAGHEGVFEDGEAQRRGLVSFEKLDSADSIEKQ